MSKVWWFVFILGWSGSILQFRQYMIKVGSKSWLLTCSSNRTLSLPVCTVSRELTFHNGYISLLYFWVKVLLFCLKERSCKQCSQNEWTISPQYDKVNNLDTNKVNHLTCTWFNNCVLVQKRLQIQYTFLLLTAFFFIPREA